MSDRFAPIPYAALAVVGLHGRLAVLDLYTRAHTASWAPFSSTDRDLAEAWGVDRRRVTSIIEALTSGGFITVSRPDKWCARTYRVREPFSEPASEPETKASTPQQLTLDVPASAPASVPASVPTRAGEVTHAQNRTELNRTEPSPKTDKGDELPVEFTSRYATHMRSLGLPEEPTKTERSAVLRCLKRFDIQKVILVLDWACTSPDFTARSNRESGRLRSETPWRLGRGGELGNFEKYYDLATAQRIPTVNRKGGDYQRRADDILPTVEVPDDLPF